MSRPLVSICIPTYNGAGTLAQTLDSIVSQAFDGLEVVVCDDRSTDATPAIAEDYARRHPFIRVARNEKNLGMDRNFTQSVLEARGAYVWMCGQDDLFYPGAFGKLREILARHPAVDVVYFNYRFLSGDVSKDVLPPRLALAEDAYLESGEAYFRVMDHAPTFLAATVMRRALWDGAPYEKFFDTHYVQMGVVLYSLPRARTYVVADARYVGCRVPEDSWKISGGKMLFEIFSGSLEVYDTVYRMGGSCVPEPLYRAKMREFLRKLPSYVAVFGERDLRVTPFVEARMRRLYGRWPLLYWLYVWPVLHLPRGAYNVLLRIRRALRGSPRPA